MHEERGLFRVYLSDTGLLLGMCSGNVAGAVAMGDDSLNMGSIAENAVCKCLVKARFDAHYYRKDSGEIMMDLDFVVERGEELCIIEVKSRKHRNTPSIKKAGRYFDVDRRVVFERSNISVDEEGIEHYPLFAVEFADSLIRET